MSEVSLYAHKICLCQGKTKNEENDVNNNMRGLIFVAASRALTFWLYKYLMEFQLLEGNNK